MGELTDQADSVFRILLIGDFSNSGGAHANPQPRRVDRDTIEDALAEWHPALSVGGQEFAFRSIEDFHPDRLVLHLPARRVEAKPAPPPQKPAATFSGSLLDAMIDEAQPKATNVSDANDLPAFIRRVSAGHVAPKEQPKGPDARIDNLRAVLHQPEFQALEGVWRAASLVVDAIDDESTVRIYLLDATLPGLIRNLSAVEAATRKIGNWGCLAAAYTFGQSDTEVQVLKRLAIWAQGSGAAFLAGGAPGDESEAWHEFRRSPEAVWIGLALPRFLLRLPYGKNGSAIDSFPFEEIEEQVHSDYLWGSPAFLCAMLLGQSAANGRLVRKISGLPLYVYHEDGDSEVKPCAEVWLTEREATTLIDDGFIPLASVKNEDSVLVVRYQSVATPMQSLAGLEQSLAKHRSAG